MIQITQISPPRKVSGKSSLLITTKPFNPEAINAIKSLPVAVYHKADFMWEVPISDLARLLDTLTFLDDIQLGLNIRGLTSNSTNPSHLPSEGLFEQPRHVLQIQKAILDSNLKPEEISEFKITPFPHQIDGINFGLSKNGWLLLDEPGLGKTLQTIYLAETLKKRGLIDHCLIICGVNALKLNWVKEIQKCSNMSCRVLGERITRRGTRVIGSIKERLEQLKNPIDEFFVITNIETLRNDAIIAELKNKKSINKFGLIAVDEAHRVNKGSTQGDNLLKITAPYRVAITGSLITNNPMSAFTSLKFTGNEQATLTTFRAQYCRYGGFNGKEIIGYQNLDLLAEEVQDCSIRRKTEDVITHLPPITLITEVVEMTDDHRKFYENIKAGVKEAADKIELSSKNLLALTTRLRQASVCPSILTSEPVKSIKLLRAVEKVEEYLSIGEKVVVMSTFKEPLTQLAAMLSKYSLLLCTGDVPDAEVSRRVDQFMQNPDYRIMLATHSKMGTGFSLNAAIYMICLDQPWTWAQFDQSCKRVHRMNNDRPAFITTLVCDDTIDERVLEIVESKKDLSDTILDGTTTEISDDFAKILKSIITAL